MADTAVIDAPDNAAPAPATEEVETPLAESVGGLAATEAEGTEPTDSGEPTEDAPDEPRYTQADIDAQIKATEARLTESFRQKAEAQQREANEKAADEAYQRNVQLASQQGQQAIAREYFAIAKDAMDRGLDAPDPNRIAQLATAAQTAAETRAFMQILQHDDQLFGEMFPGYQVPQHIAEAYARANRARDPRGIAAAKAAIIRDAAGKAEYERGRAEALAEVQGKQAAKQGTQALKAEAEARANQGKPTPGLSTVNSKTFQPKTQQEVDQALMDGRITSAQVREFMKKKLPYA